MLLRLHQDTASASSILTRRQTEPRSRSGAMMGPPRYADGNPTHAQWWCLSTGESCMFVRTIKNQRAPKQRVGGTLPLPAGATTGRNCRWCYVWNRARESVSRAKAAANPTSLAVT